MAALAHRLPGGRAGARARWPREEFSLVRGYHHYVSMARKNLREHLLGEVVRYKKYLYVLRPLLAARWIRKGAARRPCASPSWRARW